MITRDALPAAKLPEEIVHVPGLGGEVLVRGLGMSAALEAAASFAAGPAGMCELLALTVRLEDGPLWTAEEWDVFGGQHREDFLALIAAALRLSGLNTQDSEKKAPSPP